MKAALLLILALPVLASAREETLETPSFIVKIEVRCPEGCVTCDDVRYVGVSKKTGKSITLIGHTVHTTGADGVTPSRFLGYEFKSGETSYFVGEDGELTVSRGSAVLVEERGVWKEGGLTSGQSATPVKRPPSNQSPSSGVAHP